MNRLDAKTRKLIIQCLIEGKSIRDTAHSADVSKNTVTKLLVDTGKACSAFQDKALRHLPCKRVQIDGIWSFVFAKQNNVAMAKTAPEDAGGVFTWTGICVDTKLVPSWRVGDRSSLTAIDFMNDLRSRLSSRVRLTHDGHKPYLASVEGAAGGDSDYAMMVELYDNEGGNVPAERCGPEKHTAARKNRFEGIPELKRISTSYAERKSFIMRVSMRRFTRPTNAFRKKVENHCYSVALHFMHYNFCRPHRSLNNTTPTMAAGITDRLWDADDIEQLVTEAAPAPKKRGSHKKRDQNPS